MLLVIALYVLFTSMIFMHSAIMVDNPYPFFVAAFRTIVGGLFLLGVHVCSGKSIQLSGMNMRQVYTLFLHAIILYTCSLAGFAAGMQYIDGITACFILATAPFITALILYLRDKEILTMQKCVGLLLGFIALIPIILTQHEPDAAHQISANQVYWGQFLFFVANICYAYGWILAQDLVKVASEFSPSLLNAYAMLIGGICSAILYVGCEGFHLPQPVTSDFWYLLLLFTLATLINYNLYAYLLRFYSATFLSFAGFLEPALALIYSILWLASPATMSTLGALCALGLGLYLFYQEELRTPVRK